MTDAPTTKIEKRFNLGCLILGIAVTLGPILYFVILAFVDNPVGFVPPTFSSKDVTPESLAFGPDGTLLALADRDGNVAVWNIRTGKAEFQVKRQVERMEEPPLLAFSGEGGFLGAGFNDGEVAVWSLIDSSIKWAAREHDAGIVHIKWHGTEPVVSACDSSTGQITWDAGAGKVIMAFPDAAKIMNLDRLKQSTAGMPPHVGTFIEVTGPNEVSVVRYRKPTIVDRLQGKPDSVQLVHVPNAEALRRRHLAYNSRQSAYIAGQAWQENRAAMRAGVLYIIDTESGRVESEVPFGRPDDNLSLLSVAVSPDGKVVAVGLTDGVHMFDVDERGRLRPWPRDPQKLQTAAE